MLLPSNIFRQQGLLASLALHAVTLVCATLFRPPALPEAVQQVISVELVTMPMAVTESLSSREPVLATPQAELTEAPPVVPPEMIHASRMLANAAFADPKNAEAREALGQLDARTLREQLCGVEAMEQIAVYNLDWKPESVVAYAFSDALVEGSVMTAEGAAVQIGTQWRRLAFVCTLAPDLMSVVAFDFLVGDIVSDQETERYGLVIGHMD